MMSEINIQGHLQKLKEDEKHKLVEIRRKKLADQEHIRKALEKQNEEEELRNLRRKEESLVSRLAVMKKRNFQLQVDLSSWESVAKLKSNQLKIMDEKLDRSHERIWQSREEFCDQADSFIHKLEDFSQQFSGDKTLVRKAPADFNALDDEIDHLNELIAEEEKKETELREELEKMAKEEERLSSEPIGPEFKRLEEWIQITRDRCTELERRITEKKKLIDEKKNVSDPMNNAKLFSILNLEDVKKLTRLAQFNESK